MLQLFSLEGTTTRSPSTVHLLGRSTS